MGELRHFTRSATPICNRAQNPLQLVVGRGNWVVGRGATSTFAYVEAQFNSLPLEHALSDVFAANDLL